MGGFFRLLRDKTKFNQLRKSSNEGFPQLVKFNQLRKPSITCGCLLSLKVVCGLLCQNRVKVRLSSGSATISIFSLSGRQCLSGRSRLIIIQFRVDVADPRLRAVLGSQFSTVRSSCTRAIACVIVRARTARSSWSSKKTSDLVSGSRQPEILRFCCSRWSSRSFSSFLA